MELRRLHPAYESHRKDGEFWYYICCNPYGNVLPNRFLDYPLSRVRVLHWLNFSENLTGYLHWGLNYWGKDPFGTPSDRLPPGDTHVVYPGSQGPLNSIRWEIQRECIEDFEYLHLLATQTAAVKQRLGPSASWVRPERRAMELARFVVPAITEPGATVKVNGKPVTVESDGHFTARTGAQIRVEADHGGKTKTILRSFNVRKE